MNKETKLSDDLEKRVFQAAEIAAEIPDAVYQLYRVEKYLRDKVQSSSPSSLSPEPAFLALESLWSLFKRAKKSLLEPKVLLTLRLATPYPAKVGDAGPNTLCEAMDSYFELALLVAHSSLAKLGEDDSEDDSRIGLFARKDLETLTQKLPFGIEKLQQLDDSAATKIASRFSERDDYDLMRLMELRVCIIKEAQRAANKVPPFSTTGLDCICLHPKMDPDTRQILQLAGQGISNEQISKRTGKSLDSIRKARSRYSAKLKQ